MKYLIILCLTSYPLLAAESELKLLKPKEKKGTYNLELKTIKVTKASSYEILFYQNILLQEGEPYLAPFSLEKKTFAH